MNLKPTPSPVLNIIFNEDEFVIVTETSTIIYNLPIQSHSQVEIPTFANPLGLCAHALNQPS